MLIPNLKPFSYRFTNISLFLRISFLSNTETFNFKTNTTNVYIIVHKDEKMSNSRSFLNIVIYSGLYTCLMLVYFVRKKL